MGALGIRAKITIGMLIAALLPLVLFWGISYYETKRHVVEDVEGELLSVAGRQATHADDWLDGTLRGMKFAAANPMVAEFSPSVLRTVTQRLVSNYPWLVASFVAGKDGQQIARSNNEKLSNIGDRDYFKSALDGKISTQVAISKANNQPVLLAAAPITGLQGDVIGVLGISSELTAVSSAVALEKVGSSGFSFLLDENGKLIAHPDKAKTEAAMAGSGEDFRQHPAVQALAHARSPAGTSFVSLEEGGRKWVAAAMKTRQGWIMVAQMEEREAFAPLRALNIQVLLALFGATVLVLILSLLLGRKLSAPVVLLTRVTDNISKGQFDDASLDKISAGDEIGDLAAAVKRLSASVQLAMSMLHNPS